MPFSEKIKREAMIACGRRCCICHKSCGNKMEVHHIIPHSEGGEDTFENAIPLCFDCHAEAGHYNPNHPKGIKFSKEELKKHRDNWYKKVKEEKANNNDNNSAKKLDPIKIYRQKDFQNIALEKVDSGKDLLPYIRDACAMDCDYDEPKTREEAELVAEFVDKITEILDFQYDYLLAGHVMLGFDLSDFIQRLDKNGLWVFCGEEIRQLFGGINSPSDFPTFIIRILRKDNPEIKRYKEKT